MIYSDVDMTIDCLGIGNVFYRFNESKEYNFESEAKEILWNDYLDSIEDYPGND